MSKQKQQPSQGVLNKRSNEELRRSKGHTIQLFRYHTTITYSEWTGRGCTKRFSDKLPMMKFNNTELTQMIADKRLAWQPHLEVIYVKQKDHYTSDGHFCGSTPGFLILKMQDYVFIILDFDKNNVIQVETAIKDHWINDFNPLITDSLSKNHAHMIIMLDISNLPKDGCCYNREEGLEKYKEGVRYQTYKAIGEFIATEIENDTGLVIDKATIGSHIAYNPLEIQAINEFFKDKNPIKITEKMLQEKAINHGISLRNQYLTSKVQPLINEFEFMFFDQGNTTEDIINWINRYFYDENQEISPNTYKYYIEALTLLEKNKEIFYEHLKENFYGELMSLFKGKTKELGISVIDNVNDFFGFKIPKRLATYFRRILIYMLCLKKSGKYIKKVRTDKFDVVSETPFKQFFDMSLLNGYWYSEKLKTISAEQVSQMLGNGRTFTSILYLCPLLVSRLGLEEAIELFNEGLDLSCANDKTKRKKDFAAFARKCAHRPWYGKGALAA